MRLEEIAGDLATRFGGAPFGVLLLQQGTPAEAQGVRGWLRRWLLRPASEGGETAFRKSLDALLQRLQGRPAVPLDPQSPACHYGARQAAGIEKRLRLRGRDATVRFALAEPEPLSVVLHAFRKASLHQVVVLCLHPQYAPAITGRALGALQQAVEATESRFRFRLIDRWYGDAGYLDLLAARVQEGIEGFAGIEPREVHVLFLAPTAEDTGRGDPYLDDLEATRQGVMARLPAGIPHALALCPGSAGPEPPEALHPGARVEAWARDGARCVLSVPLGVANDALETLCDVDVDLRRRAHGAGITAFHRVPGFNDDPRFLDVLADLVERRLGR